MARKKPTYEKIIEWYKKNDKPYDEKDFKKTEDVQKKLREILSFATEKSQTLSEKSRWGTDSLVQGVKGVMDIELDKNNFEYRELTETKIENTSVYDAVANIKIDQEYESETVNRLTGLKNTRLQEIQQEEVKAIERSKLKEIEKERIPERIRPVAAQIVEQKLRKTVSARGVKAKTLKQREREFRETGFELPQELKAQIREKQVAEIGEARIVSRDIRRDIVGVRSLEDLSDIEKRLNENIELIQTLKGGERAITATRAMIEVKRGEFA